MITVELEKEDLINLVCGTEPSARSCCALTKLNYMRDTGGSWGCDWKWEKGTLRKLDENRLLLLYKVVTEKVEDRRQEENIVHFNIK